MLAPTILNDEQAPPAATSGAFRFVSTTTSLIPRKDRDHDRVHQRAP